MIPWLDTELLEHLSHYPPTSISVSPTIEIRSEQARKETYIFIQTIGDNLFTNQLVYSSKGFFLDLQVITYYNNITFWRES